MRRCMEDNENISAALAGFCPCNNPVAFRGKADTGFSHGIALTPSRPTGVLWGCRLQIHLAASFPMLFMVPHEYD